MINHKILITGGGGFIGTQVAWELHTYGYDVTIVDREPPSHYFPGIYKVADYLEYVKTTDIQFDIIIHLAAEHLVSTSVLSPEKYYQNNVVKMKEMLDIMVERKIKNIIFSSTGNVYGRQGKFGLINEDSYYDPENPYASSKVAGELLIKDYARAYGLRYINFRYFNASGADPTARFGYVQKPATHLIPIICQKLYDNTEFQIFGNDYPTKDGTCIRDYVHVADLAKAHKNAINLLDSNSSNHTFNLGGGSNGISVKDIISYTKEVTGKSLNVSYFDKREGDPAILVANITKARSILNWIPKYNIHDIIFHAWKWDRKIRQLNAE